jgi:hypothetical protein
MIWMIVGDAGLVEARGWVRVRMWVRVIEGG